MTINFTKRNQYTFNILSCFFISVAAFITSCKKEYPTLPYNDIQQFSIKDQDGNTIKAAIQGNDIIVYYPPFQPIPTTVVPQIVVSEGATVKPASGHDVAFKTGFTYEVTAANGSVKTYTLKALINQPKPVIEVYDTRKNDLLIISAEYLLPDTNQTKLYLVNAAEKSVQVSGATFSELSASRLIATVPVAVDTGYYRVKVVSGTQSVISQPIHIDRQRLMMELPQTTVKRGGEIVITSADGSLKYYLKDIGKKAHLYSTLFDFVEVEVTGVSEKEIKIKVPSNFAGNNILSVEIEFPDYFSQVSPDTGKITVTD